MTAEQEKFISYLYGELEPAVRDEFEQLIFADEDVASQLDETENDLIDSFVRDEMDRSASEKFRDRYLTSPSRISRVELARSLAARSEKMVAMRYEGSITFIEQLRGFFFTKWLPASAAVALLIAIGGFWYLSTKPIDDFAVAVPTDQNSASSNDIPLGTNGQTPETTNVVLPDSAGNASATNSKANANKVQPDRPTPPRIYALTLFPTARSSGAGDKSIPPGAGSVRLTIVHNNKEVFEKYSVVLKDSSGAVAFTREIRLTERSVERPVTVKLPAGSLKSGSFEVELNGISKGGQTEAIGFYSFRVEK